MVIWAQIPKITSIFDFLEVAKTVNGGRYYFINTKKVAYVFHQSIVYPLVQFDTEHKSKKNQLFLSNEEYCSILYDAEHTEMSALL